MQAGETQAHAQAARHVLVGNAGARAGIDSHVRCTAYALDFRDFAVAEVAWITHLDDQIFGAARITREFALAPVRVRHREIWRQQVIENVWQGSAQEFGRIAQAERSA